ARPGGGVASLAGVGGAVGPAFELAATSGESAGVSTSFGRIEDGGWRIGSIRVEPGLHADFAAYRDSTRPTRMRAAWKHKKTIKTGWHAPSLSTVIPRRVRRRVRL